MSQSEHNKISASSATMKARRKPVTYSKVSKEPLLGSLGPIRTILIENKNDQNEKEKKKDYRLETLMRRVRASEPAALATYEHKHDTSSSKHLRTFDLDMEKISQASPATPPPQRLNYGVYDVPSSDEDQRMLTLGSRIEHKRRKLQSNNGETRRSSGMSTTHPGNDGNRFSKTSDRITPSATKKCLSTKSRVGLKHSLKSPPKYYTNDKSFNDGNRIQKPMVINAEGRRHGATYGTVLHNHIPQAPRLGKAWPRYATSDDHSDQETSQMSQGQVAELDEGALNLSSSVSSDTSTPIPRTPQPMSERSREFGAGYSLSPSGLDIPSLRISFTSTLTHPTRTDVCPKDEHSVEIRVQKEAPLRSRRTRLVDRLIDSHTAESDDEFNEDMIIGLGRQARITSKSTATTETPLLGPHGLEHDMDRETQQGPSQPASLIPAPAPRVTYTARNRTVLKEQNEDLLLSIPVPESLGSILPSRRSVSALSFPKDKLEHLATKDPEEYEGSQTTSMRSIHELREAGVNARVSQEMESLLDDLENSVTVSQERSALQELTVKLGDPSFIRQFIDKGFESRLSNRIDPSTDPLVKALLVAALLQIVANPGASSSLLHLTSQANVGYFCNMLRESENVVSLASHRKSNFSKYCQMEFRRLSDSLLKTPNLWRYGRPNYLTLRSLSLQCLEYIVRYSREAGFMQDVLSADDMNNLVAVIAPPSSRNTRNYVSETDLLLALSILESSTINHNITKESPDRLWTNHSIENVARLLPCIQDQKLENLGRIWTLALRLSLNLTNNSSSSCDLFSSFDIIEAVLRIIQANFLVLSTDIPDGGQDLILDNLILSLGFLINLAERSDATRLLFLSYSGSTQNPLDMLLQIFISRLQSAFEVYVPIVYIFPLLTVTGRLGARIQNQRAFWVPRRFIKLFES